MHTSYLVKQLHNGAQSLLKFGFRRVVFYHSCEKRSEVKVNLPDFRRFAVIGLVVERNVALG